MADLKSFMALHGATLVDNGYRIVPIKPADKAPGRYDAISNSWLDAHEWSRFCERAPTDLEVTNWESWPGSGVGIACGNVVGIDIDILDVGMATRVEELAREILGETEAVRFGQRPKRMLVYRCEDPFDSFDIRPLQVYAKGRQFVAFGIHPVTQRPYEWAFRSLTEVDRTDLPLITEQKAREWGEAAAKLMGVKAPTPSGPHQSHDHEPATFEAVQQALAFIPSDHDTSRADWIEIGMAIKSGLGEDGRILWHEWSARDTTRYNSKECDKQFDSFKNERANAIGVGTIFKKAKDNGWIPDGVDLYPEPPPADIHYPTFIANIIARTGLLPAEPDPEPLQSFTPNWRRDLPDGLAMFIDYAEQTAKSPQPWLSLGSALATFGALAGRRYASPTDLRTNLYCVGVADSGGGKNVPLKLPGKLLKEANLLRFVGGEKIASGAGLISAVERQPSILFPLEEIGFLFRNANDRKRGAAHMTEIVDNLTAFYSNAADTFFGTEYANKKERPRQIIEQPCLCLFGVTTPEVFWRSFSSGSTLDGSMARMIIFESPLSYPDINYGLERRPIPQGLIDLATAIVDGAEDHQALPLGDTPTAEPLPYRVPYADQHAIQRAKDIDAEELTLKRAYQGTGNTSFMARLAENATKIALVRAIVTNPKAPQITAQDLEWAYDIAKQSVDTLMKAADEYVADSEQEANLKRVQKVISRSGRDGIDHEKLALQCRFMGSRSKLGEAIDFLVDGGSIVRLEMPRSDGAVGRGRRVYFSP